MVFYLLRRGDALKIAVIFALMSPLVLVPGHQALIVGQFLGALVFVGFAGFARLRLDQRASSFEAALPIAGRHLLLTKLTAALLNVWLPVGSACLLLLWTGRGETSLLQTLLQGGAVLMLAACVPLTVRLREASLPGTTPFYLWMAVVASGVVTWFLLPPSLHFALFAVASAVLMVRAFLAVPETFELSPRAASAARKTTTGWALQKPAWWPILGAGMPWLAIFAFFVGAFEGTNVLAQIQLGMTIFQAGILVRDRSRWLQALPISRRVLLGITMITTAAPYAAGVAAGTWIYNPGYTTVKPRLQWFVPGGDLHDKSLWRTNVPMEFWRYAPGGKVPETVAPWGETGRPRSKSYMGFTLYNPYTASDVNTARFFEWQVENATQAMYGRRMSWDEYQKLGHDETPPYQDQNRENIVGFAALCFLLLTGVYVRELCLSWRLGWSRFSPYLGFAAVLVVCGWLAIDLPSMKMFGTFMVPVMLHVFFRHLAGVLPYAWPALLAVTMAPSVVLYWLTQRQFASAELTVPLVFKKF